MIQVIRAAELGASILPLVSGAAAEGATAWIVVTDLPEPVFATLLAPGAEPAVRALPGFAATVVVRRSVVADSSGNP